MGSRLRVGDRLRRRDEGSEGRTSGTLSHTSREDLADGLRVALKELHRVGITHWQDACVGAADELGVPDTFPTYLDAMREGWLSARVRGALWWDRTRGIAQLADFQTRREIAPEGAFRATSVKMMLDGVCETFTAAMSHAYLGEPGRHGTHRGELFIEPDQLADDVRTLDAEGFQVHFHSIGDRAVTTALDALEGIEAARWGLNRHHIAHLQFIAPHDRDRFALVGTTANFQPLWACYSPQMEDLTIPFVGEERSAWQYTIQSLLDRHARVAFGSDWPVSSPDPLQEIHVAVNRMASTRLADADSREATTAFYRDQALTVDQAVDAFTKGVAYVNGDDDILGVLDVGRRADVARPGPVRHRRERDRVGQCRAHRRRRRRRPRRRVTATDGNYESKPRPSRDSRRSQTLRRPS